MRKFPDLRYYFNGNNTVATWEESFNRSTDLVTGEIKKSAALAVKQDRVSTTSFLNKLSCCNHRYITSIHPSEYIKRCGPSVSKIRTNAIKKGTWTLINWWLIYILVDEKGASKRKRYVNLVLSICLMSYFWQKQKTKSKKVSSWWFNENLKVFEKVTNKAKTPSHSLLSSSTSSKPECSVVEKRVSVFGHDKWLLFCRKQNKRFESECLI